MYSSTGTAPQDIQLLQDSALPGSVPQHRQSELLEIGADMYQYRTLGKFHGVPVHPSARQLLVRNDAQLQAALQLQRQPGVFLQWVSPEVPQKVEQYRKLLQRAQQGFIYISQQTKQYDASGRSYLIFVKYMQLTYTLNPRFRFLLPDDATN